MRVFPARGAIAQLGERYNGIVEVIGSIPISSTTRCNSASSQRGKKKKNVPIV
jgi:hypothetical protein